MLGAFVFGLMSRTEKDVKPYHPTFYVGVTTGFAGSCTTFSSWMLEVGVTMWNPSGVDNQHDWPRQILRGLLLLIGGFHCLYSSLKMGQWVGQVIADKYQSRQALYLEADELVSADAKPAPAAPVALYTVQNAVVYWTILFGVWTAVIIQALHAASEGESELAVAENSGKFCAVLQAGMCFAPLGAWIRFQLSKYNPRFPTFPAFTFAANILGTLVSVSLWIVAREIIIDMETPMWARADVWVAGISGGFCGCLSTASTFANELDKLARGPANKPSTNALAYGTASLLGAQALLCVAINAYLA
jgi:fluoride ion exporter CrcB/FEX